MDDEQDDYREPDEYGAAEMHVESEYRAEADERFEVEDRSEADDRVELGRIEEPPVPEQTEEPPVSDEPEEPEEPAYTPEEYQLAQTIKAKRLFKEENNRPPHTGAELSHFLMKADIERPLRPDDEDLEAARRKLEAAGS